MEMGSPQVQVQQVAEQLASLEGVLAQVCSTGDLSDYQRHRLLGARLQIAGAIELLEGLVARGIGVWAPSEEGAVGG